MGSCNLQEDSVFERRSNLDAYARQEMMKKLRDNYPVKMVFSGNRDWRGAVINRGRWRDIVYQVILKMTLCQNIKEIIHLARQVLERQNEKYFVCSLAPPHWIYFDSIE